MRKFASIWMLLLCVVCQAGTGWDVHLVKDLDNWHDANSWSPAKVPDGNAVVYIDMTNACRIRSGKFARCQELFLGTVNSGTLNVDGNLIVENNLFMGESSGTSAILSVDSTAAFFQASTITAVGNAFISLRRGRLRCFFLVGESANASIGISEGGRLYVYGCHMHLWIRRTPEGGAVYSHKHLEGDLDLNGIVDLNDFTILANTWLQGYESVNWYR